MIPSPARIIMATACLLLLPAAPATAETFYNKDGVRLSATAQEIDPGAATCRIREARHTAEEYARLKANDGQPLNVWRIEMLVANYSGKTLDYLSAHVNVESEWPPCDHWDGPEASYGEPVVWTGPLMSIQRVAGVEPGEEVRQTAFVLAYHEEEPAFGRWDIDYDFAAGVSAATAAAGTEQPTRSATSAQGERTPGRFEPGETCAGKEVGSSCWMEIENQPGCYLWNPNLQRGEVVTWTGDCSGGRASGTGERRWKYTNSDGEAASSSGSGQIVGGKEHGPWVQRLADGGVHEGSYVDGKRNGPWVERLANGGVHEGPFVDGKRHGHWTERTPTKDLEGSNWKEIGGVFEGPYVDGKRHGRWTRRWASGIVWEGPYSDGKKNGGWVERLANGAVHEGPFVDGKRHGHWVERSAEGDVQEGPYVDGRRSGHWVERTADGVRVNQGPYVNGRRSGHWVDEVGPFDLGQGLQTHVYEGTYVDGDKRGRWKKTVWREGEGQVSVNFTDH